MNYLLPERLDRLAREYVLGTLTGRARRRFERVLQQSPSASMAVHAWQERLGVLAAGVPAMQPREAVWQGLQRRLFVPAGAQRQSLWSSFTALLSGRTLAGALAGALLCVLVLRSQPGLLGLEPRSDTLPQSYVGLLLDAQGKPAVLASSKRQGRQLTLKMLQPLAVPAGQVAELWALRNDGSTVPVSVLPALPAKGSVSFTLPATSEVLFSNAGRLAVSIEPRAAQPGEQPTQGFVVSGHCVKLW